MKTRILFLFATFVFLSMLGTPSESRAQVPCNVNDSTALVAFYTATNGPNWVNHTNWLTGPVYSWWGIGVIEDPINVGTFRVTSIWLSYNNLTGPLSPILGSLDYLSSLVITGNNVAGIIPPTYENLYNLSELYLEDNHLVNPIPSFVNSPNLTSLNLSKNNFTDSIPAGLVNHNVFSEFIIDHNHFTYIPPKDTFLVSACTYNLMYNAFTFEDVLPYKLPPNAWYIFLYGSQDSVLQEIDTTVLRGSDLVLDSWVDTCQNNRYHWKQNGTFLTPNPVVTSQLIKNNIQFADSGNYTCDITNGEASNLTLHRRMIHVHVMDTLTGVPALAHVPDYELVYMPDRVFLNIIFHKNASQHVSCHLYDMAGREVRRLYSGGAVAQELHYYLNEMQLSKGVYFVKLETNGTRMVKKVVVP